MRYLKPLDTELLDAVAARCGHVATIEGNSVIGGLGSGIVEYLHQSHPEVRCTKFGLPDAFVTHGSMDELYRELGLDAPSLSEKIMEFHRKP
jgi:1-deoxy-D-xylulose-5-phosphate synthase